MAKKTYTSGHIHEALDRTSNVLDIVERQLVSHKVFKQNKRYKKRINRVSETLAELYQLIGVEMDSTDEGSQIVSEITATENKSQLLQDRAQELDIPVIDVKVQSNIRRVVICTVDKSLPPALQDTIVRQLSDSMYICNLTDEQFLECSIDISMFVADYTE